jgi:isopentenyl-diphosphate delta-isomerase
VPDGELWDLVDEHGAATGDVFRRGQGSWPAGRFHLVVATCVVRTDGLLLMTRRSAGKEFPQTWEFPGGSAISGESSRHAASRELREETGLLVEPSALRLLGRHAEASALVDLFLAAVPGRPALTLDAVEVEDAEWVTMGEASARRANGQMASVWTGRLSMLWPVVMAAVAQVGPR